MSAADTSFDELWARAERITALEATATLRDAQRGRNQHGPNLSSALLLMALALVVTAALLIGPRAVDHIRHGCTTSASQVTSDSC